MRVWLVIFLPSVFLGILCAYFLRNRWGLYLSAVLPWTALLGLLLYDVYMTSYNEPDTSEWIMAQLIGGTFAALVGMLSYRISLRMFSK